MKKIIPLMQREWLQHRFGWALMALVPLALGLLLTGFGEVQIGDDEAAAAGSALPAMMAMVSIAITTALVFAIVWASSLIIVSGLARRDNADRSVEFWLSLPTGHAESLASPLLVHLLLAPAVALLVGLLGGYAVSLVLVSRLASVAEWLALPWRDILLATFAVTLRLLAGLPLATLWLLPLILSVVLLTAWFKRWGWVILAVGIGLGGLLLDRLFGQPLLSQTINGLVVNAAHALVHSADANLRVQHPDDAMTALRAVPGWALGDAGRALRDLASPLLAGGLAFAAACFALLVAVACARRGGSGMSARAWLPVLALQAAAALAASAVLGACVAAAPPTPAAAPTVAPIDQAWADVARLSADAGCGSDAQCHSIGVGSKACGGPAGYLAWSSQRSDGAALAAAVQRHAALAAASNQRSGRASTCAIEPDPGAACTGTAPAKRCELRQR